jgi:hypothetical protein
MDAKKGLDKWRRLLSIQKSANWVEITAHEEFDRRHIGDIPWNPFSAQRRY